MVPVRISPFDIHFGDMFLEFDWQRKFNEISPKLIENIKKEGIIDPIIVYSLTSLKSLEDRVRNSMEDARVHLFGWKYKLWMWRGTQRLRIARHLNLPEVKAIILDEPKEEPPRSEELQKFYRKQIKVFYNTSLDRWDILGDKETGSGTDFIIYE